jgi:hypothetical protein
LFGEYAGHYEKLDNQLTKSALEANQKLELRLKEMS